MISRAAAYHSGFNSGFNIAEAVNFGLTDWLDIGNNVNFCRCVNDSVSINMRMLYTNLKLDPSKYLNPTQYREKVSPEKTIFKTEKVLPQRRNSDTNLGSDLLELRSSPEMPPTLTQQPHKLAKFSTQRPAVKPAKSKILGKRINC